MAESAGPRIVAAGVEAPEIDLMLLAMQAFSPEIDWESLKQETNRINVLKRSIAQMDEQVVMTVSEATPETLGAWRQGFVVTGGHSLMDPMAMISSPGQLLRYAPRALAVGFLAPFPRQWLDIRGSTGVMRAMAGVEMLLWYLLVPCAIVGMWRWVRHPQPGALFLLATIFAIAIPLSLVVANLGTLFRLRLLFLLPLLLVAAAADPIDLYRRLGQRVVGLVGRGTPRPAAPEDRRVEEPIAVGHGTPVAHQAAGQPSPEGHA